MSSTEPEINPLEKNRETAFQQDKKRLIQCLEKRHARLEKSLQKLNAQLADAKSWPEKEHHAHLLQTNFSKIVKGSVEITVQDWISGQQVALSLDPLLTASEQLERRYRQIKKCKRAIDPLTKHIARVEEQITQLKSHMAQVAALETEEEFRVYVTSHGLLPQKAPSTRKAGKLPRLPFTKYLTEEGLEIWVGKNARGNEALTFQYANGLDWWLHVADYPGSHVLIRTKGNEAPNQECLQDALQLALESSKAPGEAEVVVTQRKHLSRPKNSPAGTVYVAKRKLIRVVQDQERLERIKRRSHSSSLKR